MKNICVIGHANNTSVNETNSKWADVLVEWCLKNNHQLTTGGCVGIPEIVANKMFERGGKVLGYSPGVDENEHITEFGFSGNKDIKMRYIKPTNASRNAKFLIRSIDLIDDADLVVCFRGTWGTLSEIVFAVMCSKQILFLNIDGDNNVLKEIYDLMQTINLYDWHEKFVEVKSIEKFKEELEKYEKTGEI